MVRLAKRVNDTGQAMLEFVLVFPVVMLLLMGIIEFSMLANAHQMVNYAAFNAARSAAVNGDKQFAAAISTIAISPTSVRGLDPGRLVPNFILNLLNKVAGIENVGQKTLYAYALTRMTPIDVTYYDKNDKKLSSAKNAAYLRAVVTFYYPLKFPVISTVADLAAHTKTPNLPWPLNDSVFFHKDDDYYTAQRWAVAARLTHTTGIRFIPIVKDCYMGIQ